MEPARLTTEAADLRESVLPHQLIPAVPNRIFKVNPDPAQCETKSFITVTLLFNQVDNLPVAYFLRLPGLFSPSPESLSYQKPHF